MSSTVAIDARFYALPEDLRHYFTTFYVADVRLGPGEFVEDSLQPEWGNLRFFHGIRPESWIDDDKHVVDASFTATGPSSRCVNFVLGSTRMWGIGFLPAGWARFVREPANSLSNLITDGHRHPSFARFVPLADTLFGDEADEAGEFERIVAFFRSVQAPPSADEAKIQRIHAALIDPEIASVAELVEQLGMSQRMLERTCHRYFGFSPKLLLRRQRFMRSLTQFMLDPSIKWVGAIDSRYHDQAQFVRDFHHFMGCTPRQYAARPHPVLKKFMQVRAEVYGTAVQTLDSPGGANANLGNRNPV